MTKLDAALAWSARGFRVFPIVPNTKTPAIERFYDYATTDPDVIRTWWHDNPDYNIGSSTTDGAVMDVDTKHGPQALENYRAIGGHFDTFVVQSPSGGYHCYFWPSKVVANSQGSLVEAVDVRGWHGYVLAPGSTIDGAPYVLLRDHPIAYLPDSIERRCKEPRDRAEPQPVVIGETDTAAMIQAAINLIQSAPPAISGQGGNNQTYAVATRVRELGISMEYAVDLMIEHYNPRCEPEWLNDEIRGIVHNAYSYAENPIGFRSPDLLLEGVVALPEPPPMPAALPTTLALPERPLLRFGNCLPAAALVPRPWLYTGLLERHENTGMFAPGGVGKSLAMLTIASHAALGMDCWGFTNRTGQRIGSVIYNAEDSLNEMSMRLVGLCQEMNWPHQEVMPYIMLISGKTHGHLRLVELIDGRPIINTEAYAKLMTCCSDPGVGFLGLDPLVRLHNVNENDNSQMTDVIDAIVQLATAADVAACTPHHMAKPPQAGSMSFNGNAYAGRGAGGIAEACRVAVTLGAPTSEDVLHYGLTPYLRQRLVRVDDAKLNRGIRRGEPLWLYKRTVILPNREEVGVFVETDIKDHQRDMRERVALAVYADLQMRQSSWMTLTEAAVLLVRNDPIFGQYKPSEVRQKLETMLTQPAEFGYGGTVSLHVKDNTKLIVLS